MKRTNRIIRVVAMTAVLAVGSQRVCWADKPDEAKGAGAALVRPVPHIMPHQPRLGFYGHLEPGWGMMVDYVLRGTPAFWTGLERGDVILRINHRPIRSYRDYFGALRTSGPVCWLLVDDVHGRGRIWVVCHLRRHPGPIPLHGPEPPRTGTATPEGQPPGAGRSPASKKKPPRTVAPGLKEKPSRPSRRAPEATASDELESGKGPLL